MSDDVPAARRTRRLRWLLPAVLAVLWLALGALAGPFAGKLGDVVQNDSSAFLPRSAEATQAQAQARAFVDREVLPAVVVAERSTGLTAADREFLAERSARIARLPGVEAPASPVIPAPRDDRAVQVVVGIDATGNPGDVATGVREALEDAPRGLTVLVTGPAAQIADLVVAFGGIDGVLLLVAGAVVALILVVVYRSPLLPLLVLMSAVFALGLASLTVYLLADNGIIDLNGQSQGILSILVFGAATDYALLLVSRFREQLRDTGSRFDAMRAALRGTVEPIVASAATVILGVLCLLFSELNSNKALGPVAAIGIASALVASLTFLPAVLVLFGRAIFWPRVPALGSAHPEAAGVWGKVAEFVGRSPRAIWIGVVLVLAVGVAFLPQLKATGTSQSDVFLDRVDSVTGQQVLERHFPGGTGAPTVVIANAGASAAVRSAAVVAGVERATVVPPVVGGRSRVEVVLRDAPDSTAAVETVQRVRDAVHAVPGADAVVGGPTAVQLDTRIAAEHDRDLIIPIVLVVIFLVLALLLRALLAPLLLIATVVLSFAATMGLSAVLFNSVFGFPGADPVVPLFGFVFLVALGVDYNIFLMTRVREETRRSSTRAGTLRGLAVTGGVITSAGVVLAATFAALAVIPILFLAQLAFIVAVGVLIDTLLVRTLLVPALTLDIGRRVWWPSALSRADPIAR
ncbi:MMPL family transporter [Amycolatopsis carbonis]|uniref:MMPL family transporter n=1 Tax=Amycolatopsis carbonis TaxID=715471 RepID=A0A9Y2IQN6_9PSEU|nr:MMPL family transporter [Amycolatopsis sp. 2-15]WIX83719.1 MMPL family transporter [Amycolatopsis sp. 2-15]